MFRLTTSAALRMVSNMRATRAQLRAAVARAWPSVNPLVGGWAAVSRRVVISSASMVRWMRSGVDGTLRTLDRSRSVISSSAQKRRNERRATTAVRTVAGCQSSRRSAAQLRSRWRSMVAGSVALVRAMNCSRCQRYCRTVAGDQPVERPATRNCDRASSVVVGIGETSRSA